MAAIDAKAGRPGTRVERSSCDRLSELIDWWVSVLTRLGVRVGRQAPSIGTSKSAWAVTVGRTVGSRSPDAAV